VFGLGLAPPEALRRPSWRGRLGRRVRV